MADIRISDISVSRFHSSIWLGDDGRLTICDNHSKFGTLKLLREPLEVNSETHSPVYVQVGKVLLLISAEKPSTSFKLLDCCFKKKQSDLSNTILFEEAVNDFPLEFTTFFKEKFGKKQEDDNKSEMTLEQRLGTQMEDASQGYIEPISLQPGASIRAPLKGKSLRESAVFGSESFNERTQLAANTLQSYQNSGR